MLHFVNRSSFLLKLLLGFFLFCNSTEIYSSTRPTLRFEKPKVDGETFDDFVYIALEARNGFIWFGTYGEGLLRYDGHSIKQFKHDSDNPRSISANLITALVEDNEGYLWIGTPSNGLNRFDPRTETFTRYLPDSLAHINIAKLYQDSSGNIWIATRENGLIQLKPESGKYTQFLPDNDDRSSLSHKEVWAIIEDSSIKGNLWIGTRNGLNYFDKETKKFSNNISEESDPSSLSSSLIMTLYYDSSKILWVGTVFFKLVVA